MVSSARLVVMKIHTEEWRIIIIIIIGDNEDTDYTGRSGGSASSSSPSPSSSLEILKIHTTQGGMEDQPLEASAGAVQPRNTHCAGRYVPAVLIIIIIVIVFIIVFIVIFVIIMIIMIQSWVVHKTVPGNMYPKIIWSWRRWWLWWWWMLINSNWLDKHEICMNKESQMVYFWCLTWHQCYDTARDWDLCVPFHWACRLDNTSAIAKCDDLMLVKIYHRQKARIFWSRINHAKKSQQL